MSVLDDTKEALVELRDEQRLLSFRHDDIGFIAGYLITTIRNAGRDARRETVANEDVTKCAKCGLRTVGQFCGECVKKFAEVEQLAAQLLPHVAAADMGHSEGPSWRESSTMRHYARVSFELADAFVAERDARRGAKP